MQDSEKYTLGERRYRQNCFLVAAALLTVLWLMIQVPLGYFLVAVHGGVWAFISDYTNMCTLERADVERMVLISPFLAYMLFLVIMLWQWSRYEKRYSKAHAEIARQAAGE